MFVSHELPIANKVGLVIFAPLIWITEATGEFEYWADYDIDIGGTRLHWILWRWSVAYKCIVIGIPASWVLLLVFCMRKRQRSHLCISCSYDLTANTTGTCPECGQAIAAGN